MIDVDVEVYANEDLDKLFGSNSSEEGLMVAPTSPRITLIALKIRADPDEG